MPISSKVPQDKLPPFPHNGCNDLEEKNQDKQESFRLHNKGHWGKKQNFKFYLFVYHHQKDIIEQGARRSLQLFKGMSYFIQTRTPAQCRTHHQKVIRKFGSLSKALSFYQSNCKCFFETYFKIRSELAFQADYNFCCDFIENPSNKGNNELKEKNWISIIDQAPLQDLFRESESSEDEISSEKVKVEALDKQNTKENEGKKHIQKYVNAQSANILSEQPRYPFNGIAKDYKKEQSEEWLVCHFYYLKWVESVQRLAMFPDENHESH